MALVFYAGHGMEMDGVNYLLPVDAQLARDTDVRYETVTLDDVLAATTGAALRQPRQLRGPRRVAAGRRDARGLRGRGRNDGR